LGIDIRVVPQDDLRRWIDTIETAFADTMSDERWAGFRQILEPERTLGAYDGDLLVGGGSVFSMRLTVPGGRHIGLAGVTAVAVLPTHRRRGMLNGLMSEMFADARRRGEPAAALWASEGSIYQRYGYGLATLVSSLDIERERAVFRLSDQPLGSVRLVDIDEAVERFAAIYDVVQANTPGFLARSETWWRVERLADFEEWRKGRSRKFYALHEADGQPLAYAVYRIKNEWGDAGTASIVDVMEAIGATPAATREIWRYLFGIDLIARIQAWGGPSDHPLLLLLAEPRRLRLRLGDGLWLRILDVPAALRTRSYESDGELVLQVDDGVLPDVGGRWRLTVRGGKADVEPTGDPAELVLDVADLAAVYLGGFTFAQLAAAGRVGEQAAGALARADRLFATARQPWCPEVF
jgi:predicted acetyltransferase